METQLSRRHFLGASALGAFGAILANPARAAAESVGAKAGDLPDLTIKEVKVYVLDRRKMPRQDPAIIAASPRGQGVAAALYGGHVQIASIVTNGGIEGNYILEEHYFHPNWTTLGWLDYAKSACVGRSVLDLPAITSQWIPEKRRVGQSAYASAIDNSLWDILGKAVGLPVYRILGAYRDKVLAYASTQHHDTLEQFVEEAKTIKAQGFKAYKIHPPSPNGGHDYKLDIAVAKAVREAVGDDFTLMIDPVGVYTREEAIKVGRAVQEMGYIFYEDPLPTKDIEGLAQLCRDLDIPIHIGEFLTSIYDYPEYLRRNATDAVRFIVDNVGGISGGLKLAHMAECFEMECVPHNWGEAFNHAVHFHLELAMPNNRWFEMTVPQGSSDRPYMKDKFRIDADGYVRAPTKPGLGYEIDRDALERFLVRVDR
ncbi:MAG TPA: mandelate racemase/muconate lactonizing enzyme family protein [Opitutaceae bacterium]|jgi:L-alanine-DL-glutamate epimerase-like enolase superfamily enzyme|nr:mandelate racemase/muconate lactonizing enzyme family protein [Opitutaceae bacterium]